MNSTSALRPLIPQPLPRHPATDLAAFLLMLCLGASPLSAAAGTVPQAVLPEPEPFLASLGSSPEPLPVASLVDAALLASGVKQEELVQRRISLTNLIHSIGSAADALMADAQVSGKPADEAARAEAVLVVLHERGALRGYRESATTLVDILDRGAFNCVSSAVLYLLVLRDLGIPCKGVKTSDHAFCQVRIGGRDIDVETTNRDGFDPGTKKNFTDNFGHVTGFSYVPPGSYGRRESIGERQLVSLILSNRSAILEKSGRYADALALGSSYAALRGDTEGRTFLISRINNVAAEFSRKRDWQSIRQLVASARSRLGDDPRLSALAADAADAMLSESIDTMAFPDALASVEASAAAGEIGQARRLEFLVYLYGAEAIRLGRAGDWLGAAALASEGSARTGGNAELAAAAATHRRNYVVGVHNSFANLYNARRFSEARTVIEAGLAKVPGDKTLAADLAAATSALEGH